MIRRNLRTLISKKVLLDIDLNDADFDNVTLFTRIFGGRRKVLSFPDDKKKFLLENI